MFLFIETESATAIYTNLTYLDISPTNQGQWRHQDLKSGGQMEGKRMLGENTFAPSAKLSAKGELYGV